MQIEDSPILQEISRYLCDTLQMELLNQGHIASEALFNSIQSTIERNLFGVTIDVQALEYAKWVEAGRRKGVKGVPIEALTEWIRQKKIDLRGKRERSVAFAIQASIKRKGIKPSYFIKKSIKKFDKSKRLEKKVDKFMEQYVGDFMIEMFDKLKEK